MTELLALLRYSTRKTRGPMLALWILLFALQMLMASVARSFELSGQFSQMAGFIPAFLRPMLDPSFMAALSFSGMVCFGYSHVIVILLLTAQSIAAGTELTDEIESGFVDLLVARPIPRALVVVRSVILIVFLTVAAVGSMLIGSFVGLRLLAPPQAEIPPASVLLSLAANLAVLAASWGAIALTLAAFTRRRAVAASVTGLLAFSLFVVDFAGRLWKPIDTLAMVSPFRYYAPFSIIAGEPVPVSNLLTLSLVFVAGVAVAWSGYRYRDL